MSEPTFTRDQAAALFLERLLIRAYDGAIRDVDAILEVGPPGIQPDDSKLAWHQWFQALDPKGQACARAIVQDAVDAALFGCLVLLDGMTGGDPIRERTSDFALYLRTYADAAARRADRADLSVRINPRGTTYEDLHDLYREMVETRLTSAEDPSDP
jgi:hypothetical protein